MVDVGISPVAIEKHEAVGDAAPDAIGASFRLFGRLTSELLLFVQAGIFDGHGGLLGHRVDESFRRCAESTGFRMPKKQSADDFAGTRLHGDRQITPNGKMSLRHTFSWRIFAVTRIRSDVVRADD